MNIPEYDTIIVPSENHSRIHLPKDAEGNYREPTTGALVKFSPLMKSGTILFMKDGIPVFSGKIEIANVEKS